MKNTMVAATLWMGAACIAAMAAGAPKIQFEQTVYDFGRTSEAATVSGLFKFKNAGDAVLKVEPPKPSCGCTVAELKSDTLQPGESGELGFTLHLGQSKAQFDKRISVKSSDPQTPEVSLSIKADYMPLYELNPLTLAPVLAFSVNDVTEHTTLTRTDGKALRVGKLVATRPWIAATVEPDAKADQSSARIRVTIQREGSPRRFSEFVQVYVAGQTNTPVGSIFVHGQMMGEVSLTPEALYWSIPDAPNTPTQRPEAQILQRVTIRSATGKAIELRNPQSTIPGVKVQLIPKEAGKLYELVARLEEVPAHTVSGKVSFETSVATEYRIEVPVIVNVVKP